MQKKTIVLLLSCMLILNFFTGISAVEVENKTPSGISISELEEFVDHYVEDYIGKTVPGAAIVVVKDHQIVLLKGYGYADIENQISVEASNTVFEWGSISKLMVWTAVMQLVEQRKIDLNASIQTYLPDGFLTKLGYDEPITMLHLMNHNAGFEENIFDLCFPSETYLTTLEEGLKRAEPVQVYSPGKVVAYSNYSTSLAAYIVERITKEDFYQYTMEHIFAKLGMNHSSAHPTIADKPELLASKAKGYAQGKEAFTLSSWNYMSLYPSGGVNGTAQDLAAFAMALMPFAGKQSPLFEKADTLSNMLSQSYSPNKNVLGIAHGFWEFAGMKRGLTHGGNTIAFSSNFHLVPEENFAVMVLTNQTGELDLCYGLITALVGEGYIPVSDAGLPDAKILEGTYVAARSPHNGFLSLYPYLLLLAQVKSTGPNTIQFSLAGLSAEYVQSAPYVYEKTKGHVLFDMNRQLYFQVEHGKVQQISTSFTDYLALPAGRTMPLLIANAIVESLCLIYYLIMFLAIPIRWIINKRNRLVNQPGSNAIDLVNLAGIALLTNNGILIMRVLANTDRAYTELQMHFYINYALSGFALVAFCLLFFSRKKGAFSKRQTVASLVSVIFLMLLLGLLINWQFYC